MSLTTRILDPSEWPKLSGTEAGAVWPHLDQSIARVLVVERDAQIVACWVLMPVYHLEALWIAEDERKRSSVARRLWVGMCQLIQGLKIPKVVTSACSDDVMAMLERLDAEPLQGKHFVLRFSGET